MGTEREVFLKIFAHSKDSVFLLDPGTRKIIFANAKSEEDTSYEESELAGLPFIDLFLDSDRSAIETLLETTLQWKTGVDPERILRRKTGRKLRVEITTSVVNWEDGSALFCNVRDITERVRAREALEKLNAELEDRVQARTAELAAQKLQLDDMMGHIQQAIFTVSPELLINSEHSRFVYSVFGDVPVAGQSIDIFLGVSSEIAAVIRESLALVFAQPETWEMVSELLPKEILFNEKRDLTLEWVAMRETTDPTAPIVKVMIICQDITERKLLQAQIAEQQNANQERMDALAKMLSLPAGTVSGFMAEIERLAQECQSKLVDFWGQAQDHSVGLEGQQSVMRALHTLKGALGQLRMRSASRLAHRLESLVQERLQRQTALTRLQQARGVLLAFQGAKAETLRFRLQEQEKMLIAALSASTAEAAQTRLGLAGALEQWSEFYSRVFGSRTDGSKPNGQNLGEILTVSAARITALLEHEDFRLPAVRRGVLWVLRTSISTLFLRLEEVARSTGEDLGRAWSLQRDEGGVEIDQRLLPFLYDSLLHVVRNSIDHGGAGRELPVCLRWEAKNLGTEDIELKFIDDGNGIDLDRVKSKAVEKGLKTQSEAELVPDSEALRWIFLPGLSTQDRVTEVSGRGIGMDQVLQIIEKRLGGTLQVHSERGKGTKVTVKIRREMPIAYPKNLKFSQADSSLSPLLNAAFGIDPAQTEPISEGGVKDLWVGRRQVHSGDGIEGTQSPAGRTLLLAPLDLTDAGLASLTQYFGEQPGQAAHLLSVPNNTSRFGGGWLRAWCRSGAWDAKNTLIQSILDPGSWVQEMSLRDYSMKSGVIDGLTAQVASLRGFSGLTELVGVVAEELIMNAMFDAPRDSEGRSKYNHLPRTHALVLEESEKVILRYGADAQFFCLSIQDPAGALNLPTVRDYLVRCLKKGADQVENKSGGAGLGLYTLFGAANGLAIAVTPGQSTEVCVTFALCRTHKEYETSGRALSFISRA